ASLGKAKQRIRQTLRAGPLLPQPPPLATPGRQGRVIAHPQTSLPLGTVASCSGAHQIGHWSVGILCRRRVLAHRSPRGFGLPADVLDPPRDRGKHEEHNDALLSAGWERLWWCSIYAIMVFGVISTFVFQFDGMLNRA